MDWSSQYIGQRASYPAGEWVSISEEMEMEMKMKMKMLSSIMVVATSVTGCASAAPPGCSDPQILASLTQQTRQDSDDEDVAVSWKVEDILTLDWDAQTADLAGIDPIRDVTRLNSCAAVLIPSKNKVWVPGEKLDPHAQKNMESNRNTIDAMCSGNSRGRPADPNAATSPLCKRLQASQQRQQNYNKGVEDGGWTAAEPRKIRYVTGRFDDGRVFAKIILQ